MKGVISIMPNKSSITVPIALRISTEAYNIIEHRIAKHPRCKTVGRYVREQIEFAVTRKHKRGKR